MNKNLIPTYFKNSIYDIDFPKLKAMDIQYLFIDLDNTLASPYAKDADDRVKELIAKIKSNGLKPIVLSNNHLERVSRFVKDLDVDFVYETKKPNIKKISLFIKEHGFDLDKCIGIGDQTMTDVLFYNRLGIKVILVNPLVKQDLPITWIPRILDKYFRHQVKKHNLSREF